MSTRRRKRMFTGMVASTILILTAVTAPADDDATFVALLQRINGTNTSTSRQQAAEAVAPGYPLQEPSVPHGSDEVPPTLQGLVLYEGSPFDGRSGERAKLLPPIAAESTVVNSPEPAVVAQASRVAETAADIPVMSDLAPSREAITPTVAVFTEPPVPPTDVAMAPHAEMRRSAESFDARSIVPEESVLHVAAKEKESVTTTARKVPVPGKQPATKNEEGLQSPWGTAFVFLFLPLLVLLFLTGVGRLLSSTMRQNAPQKHTPPETEQRDYGNKAA